MTALLVACGGQSASHTGSGTSASEPRGCTYDGNRYSDGLSFAAMDGCNSCSCDDGDVTCTEIGCHVGPCDYDGISHEVGSTFTDASGNECSCTPGGSVSCEPRPVSPPISCDQVVTFYDQLLSEAKSCDPHAENPCTFRVNGGLGCGCDTFVNAGKWNEPLAAAYGSHYAALTCGGDVDCGSCRSPVRGYCSVMAGCQDAYDVGAAAACEVAGVIYPDGSQGIPDPISCNTCACTAGRLSCTEINCPRPCPAGTKLATSCAQCGAADNCEITAYACRPTCIDACAEGLCVDGACVVGICG